MLSYCLLECDQYIGKTFSKNRFELQSLTMQFKAVYAVKQWFSAAEKPQALIFWLGK